MMTPSCLALLSLLARSPLLPVKAKVVEHTLVVHLADVDTVDPRTGEPFSRLGALVNGALPGPTIEADLGDTVVMKVINEMPTAGVSIHVHGQHQVGTFYMDGVHGITQCDIAPMHSFEYRFEAAPAGTFFYHSHMPYQLADGIWGGFVVHDSDHDPHAAVIAGDVVVAISDWLRYHSSQVYQYASQFRFDQWPLAHYLSFVNGQGFPDPWVYQVAAGETHRLRLVGATVEHGYRVHLAGHKLTVIAVDGSPVAPVAGVDFLDIYSGERYDVLVAADKDGGAYELRVRAIDYQGIPMGEDAYGSAVVLYEGAAFDPALNGTDLISAEAVMTDDPAGAGYALLDPAALAAYRDGDGGGAHGYAPPPGPEAIQEGEGLKVYETTSYSIEGERQFLFMDGWDFHLFKAPKLPALFSAYRGELAEVQEEETHVATRRSYTDTNDVGPVLVGPRFQHLALGAVVDVVFQNAATPGNEGGSFGAVHPMHLHGHYYWVLGGGPGAFDPADPDLATRLNFVDPPQRDNAVVGPESWLAVRFVADNPGVWLVHCHSETHALFGMATALMVGGPDDLPDLPADFPVCGRPQESCPVPASNGKSGKGKAKSRGKTSKSEKSKGKTSKSENTFE